MRGDLKVIGLSATIDRYLTTSGTSIEAGEPTYSAAALTAGVPNSTVYVLAVADCPSIGTHKFGGIAAKDSDNVAAGTTKAQYLPCKCPQPWIGIIRGRGETYASIDTAAELVAYLQYPTLFDYSANGSTLGTQLYTIKIGGTSDTQGLEIVSGDPTLGTLDVVVDGRAYRHDTT